MHQVERIEQGRGDRHGAVVAVLGLFQGGEHQHAGGEVDAIDSRRRLGEAAADAGERDAEGPPLAVDMLGLAQKRVTLGSDDVFAVAVRRVEPNAAGRRGEGSRPRCCR